MCCTRCLQILNCIAAVLISINGMELGEDRLSNVSQMKQRELDYGERLSSMEDEQHDGLRGELDRQGANQEKLIGKLKAPKKMLSNEETLQNKNKKTTKCTTNQPIQVDENGEIKNSDETIPNGEETTEPYTNTDTDIDIDSTTDITTDNGSGTGEDIISHRTEIPTNPAGSDENRVDSDSGGEPQDPSKDKDYDATLSTKKYYGPHESYFPDHYLDDA